MLVSFNEKLKDIALKIKDIAYKLGLIADYIVETKTSGNWKYEKWNSGKYVAWTTGHKTATGSSAGSSTIGYDYTFKTTIPSGFKKVEHVSGHAGAKVDTGAFRWGAWTGWYWVDSSPTVLNLYTSGNYQNTTIGYSLKVTGTWK